MQFYTIKLSQRKHKHYSVWRIQACFASDVIAHVNIAANLENVGLLLQFNNKNIFYLVYLVSFEMS